MKIVIDTNVVASAVFFGGRPRELLEKLLLGEFTAFVSPEIVDEYQATLHRLQEKYPQKSCERTPDSNRHRVQVDRIEDRCSCLPGSG